MQQLANDVITRMYYTLRIFLFDMDEPQHLHKILTMNLHRSFTPRTIYYIGREIIEKEFNSNVSLCTGFIINSYTAKNLPHSAHPKRLFCYINLIVDLELLFFNSLDNNKLHMQRC